jgi:putative ABC transport system ATP-binding protein
VNRGGAVASTNARAGSNRRDAIASAVEVEVAYGNAVVLNGITLEMAAGEVVALMGPSGSGKSTLLLALAGLQRFMSGRIDISGRDLWKMSNTERTRFRLGHIGLVFQSSDLIPELSLLDNVALPIELAGVTRKDSLAQARVALTLLEIDDATMTRTAARVSGGQQQRAAVARALGNRPELVLADEPTGALDAEARGLVMEVLATHARAGNAVLVATHDEEVADRATRVVRLRDGALC